ncbi:MAG: LPXTG cell wall anchor domain-containing protein [Candidatus Microthrix parvicella]
MTAAAPTVSPTPSGNVAQSNYANQGAQLPTNAGSAGTAGNSALANTGISAGAALAAGVALLLVGLLLVAGARRRN